MISALRSMWVWFAIAVLILVWVPLLALIRLFDRDPVRYRTGRWFRNLGVAMVAVNPAWKVTLTGETVSNPRKPYVVVSNHQSMADIPMVSHLPWEMKWVGKIELFRLPIIGLLMRLSGDIPVDRKDRRSGAMAMLAASRYLEKKCSVMFFPEGTRSPDGRIHAFNDGAFHLAVKNGCDILPVALEGTRDCLPKKDWRFGPGRGILLKILPPIPTTGLTAQDVATVREQTRQAIIRQVAEWRGVGAAEVDAAPAGGAGA